MSAYDVTEVSHSHPTQESSHCHKEGPITSSTFNPRPHTSFRRKSNPKHTSMKEKNKLTLHKGRLSKNIKVPLISNDVGGSLETMDKSENQSNLHEASFSGSPLP